MTSITRLVAVVAGLVLLLHGTPTWGQPVCVAPGCNPTTSDSHRNTAGGTGVLLNVDETAAGGFDNTAFGFHALFTNTTGDSNTATGSFALASNTTGSNNTASGRSALLSNTSGGDNTAIGADALSFNDIGAFNTAVGFQALQDNTSGSFNTATGDNALTQNTTGGSNTASGAGALGSNTSGINNTASGANALSHNSTGDQNTAVGVNALFNSTGNKNIAIGFRAGLTLTSGNNNIYIGNQGVNSSEFQTIRLGSTQTSTFIAGIANATVSNAATVVIDTTTGQLGVPLSSARYKQDIASMGTRSEKVLELRPVTFAYRSDAQGTTHYGLIAEEVEKVYPELVTHTATGEVQAVRYQELIPMLLNELQRQQQAIKRQEQELAEMSVLRKEMAELRALVGQGRETASLSR